MVTLRAFRTKTGYTARDITKPRRSKTSSRQAPHLVKHRAAVMRRRKLQQDDGADLAVASQNPAAPTRTMNSSAPDARLRVVGWPYWPTHRAIRKGLHRGKRPRIFRTTSLTGNFTLFPGSTYSGVLSPYWKDHGWTHRRWYSLIRERSTHARHTFREA